MSGLEPCNEPDITTSPPKTDVPLSAVPIAPVEPDTQKHVSPPASPALSVFIYTVFAEALSGLEAIAILEFVLTKNAI